MEPSNHSPKPSPKRPANRAASRRPRAHTSEALPSSSHGPTGGSGNSDLLTDITDSDDFRMYCMKVLPCSKRLAHDWTTCVFAHKGEKACRRDPRKFNYTGIACVDMKDTGSCKRGDDCPYAHSTFEYWLHPTRYRTQLCKDMGDCKRETCFFAHRPEELRVPDEKPYISPEQLAMASLSGIRRSMEREKGTMKKGTTSRSGTTNGPMPAPGVVRRPQPDNLAYTPYSHAQSEAPSPRAHSMYDPTPVRSSAPLSSSAVLGGPGGANASGPSGNWFPSHQPVRRSANAATPMVNQGGAPFNSQRQRADEIALADALARLSVSLSHQGGDQSKDDVIQTVHQVLRQALDQRESSLEFDVSGLGGVGFSDGSSAELSALGDVSSARSSSDVGSPLFPHVMGANAAHAHAHSPPDTRTLDPWSGQQQQQQLQHPHRPHQGYHF